MKENHGTILVSKSADIFEMIQITINDHKSLEMADIFVSKLANDHQAHQRWAPGPCLKSTAVAGPKLTGVGAENFPCP